MRIDILFEGNFDYFDTKKYFFSKLIQNIDEKNIKSYLIKKISEEKKSDAIKAR